MRKLRMLLTLLMVSVCSWQAVRAQETITWIEVTVETAGSLGVEVMYKVDKLTDVDYLKVNGPLNDADWTSLKNMSNLIGLDLSQASFTDIPANEFQDRTSLKLVYLPEGMKTISNNAFRNTRLITLSIPTSVTTIGEYAFYQVSTLTEVSFSAESTLKSIGHDAFRGCTALSTFLMPNTVTSLGSYCFRDCTSLSNLSLSSSLTSISNYCFQNTSSLQNVVFPESLQSIGNDAFSNSGLVNVILPKSLTQLGNTAFEYCKSLQYLELPSYVESYSYTFYDCTSLSTVVCHACTPPANINEPFYYVDKSLLTLKVPSFALVDYKLDTYWYTFGTIEAMETDPSYAIISGKLSLTNNRRPNNSMDFHIYTSGDILVGGDSPMPIGTLRMDFNTNVPEFATIVNKCPNISVSNNSMLTYYLERNKWYFLSPVADVPLSDITHAAGGDFVFRYYNGQYRADNGITSGNGSWQNISDNVLHARQGYICRTNKAGWLEMPVTAANITSALTWQDVTTTLSTYASGNTANANWNYVGNPYPSYYDAYYMDFTAPFIVWDYDSSTYKTYSITDDNYVLSPMQAFFVQKPDEINSILFREVGRQAESTINRATTRENRSASSRTLYDILLTNGLQTDETRAIINEVASLDYELGHDAAKFMSMDETVPQIYSIDLAGNQLSFNERPLDDGKVRLGFYVATAGAYTLKGSPTCREAKLYDAVTGTTASLGEDGYHFTVEEGGTYNDRFTLILSGNEITNMASSLFNEAQIAAIAGGIEVRPASATEILVYDAAGRQVARAKAVSGRSVISLPAGLYLVKAGNKTYKCVVD